MLAVHARMKLNLASPDGPTVGVNALPVGIVHEWFTEGEPGLCLLTHFAARAWAAPGSKALGRGGRIAWVGRRCWPFPRRGGAASRARSILIDAVSPSERLWAADLCVRSRAVAAVVADGAGLDLAATRRLQLAAKGSRALLMLARPARELGELSAAAARWRIEPVPSPTSCPRWSVELLRCKGLRPAPGPLAWVLEWKDEAGAVLVPADVVDRPAPPPAAAGWKVA